LVTILKYDRSGRSSGIAVITYELPDEAARAIAQYNGATANGISPSPYKPTSFTHLFVI
jgi:hypothetical protein